MTILPRTEADYVKTPEVTHNVSLTEREVKVIGERRYTYPRRITMAAWAFGPGLVVSIVGTTIRNPSVTTVRVFDYALLALVVEAIAVVVYFFVKANREGKKFLKEINKGGHSD